MSIVSTNFNTNNHESQMSLYDPLNGGFRLLSPIQISPNLPSRRNTNLRLHIPSNSPFYNTSLGPLNGGFQSIKKPSPFPQIYYNPEIIQSGIYPHPWLPACHPVYYPLFT